MKILSFRNGPSRVSEELSIKIREYLKFKLSELGFEVDFKIPKEIEVVGFLQKETGVVVTMISSNAADGEYIALHISELTEHLNLMLKELGEYLSKKGYYSNTQDNY